VVKDYLIEDLVDGGRYDVLLGQLLTDGYPIMPAELATLVHEESAEFLNQLRVRCLAGGENVVIEGEQRAHRRSSSIPATCGTTRVTGSLLQHRQKLHGMVLPSAQLVRAKAKQLQDGSRRGISCSLAVVGREPALREFARRGAWQLLHEVDGPRHLIPS